MKLTNILLSALAAQTPSGCGALTRKELDKLQFEIKTLDLLRLKKQQNYLVQSGRQTLHMIKDVLLETPGAAPYTAIYVHEYEENPFGDDTDVYELFVYDEELNLMFSTVIHNRHQPELGQPELGAILMFDNKATLEELEETNLTT